MTKYHLLPLSTADKAMLDIQTAQLLHYLAQTPKIPLADVAHTLGNATSQPQRRTIVCHEGDDFMALSQPNASRIQTRLVEKSRQGVVFMFPGIGDHYAQIGRGLFETEPVFRDTLTACASLLEPYLGQSFLPLLYPKQVVNGTKKEGIDLRAMLRRGKENEGENAGILQETRFAHPLVFSLEYSLAKLLGSWGIHPTSMVGYSLGEYVAACLAGVFSLPDALKLVAERARMIQALPTGSMLTVSLAPNKISYPDGVYLSAHLGESLTVIGGETEAIVALKNSYDAQRIACQLLGTTHAFHTDMMTSAVPELTALAQGVTLSAPRIPYLSNVTGTWLTPAQATDPSYWGRHMCEPVRWHEASQLLLRQEQLLLEVGPGQSLGAFVKQHPVCSPTQAGLVLPTLRYHYDHQPDSAFLWQTVGQLWLHGYELNWGKLSAENAGIPVILPFQLEQDGAENAGIHSPRSSRRRATNTQRTRR